MSVESLSRALNVEGITAAERLVLIGIANHDGDGGAWPSIETLARYACVKPRAVQTTIAQMRERGWLSVALNAGGTTETRDDRRPNRYVIHWDATRGAVNDTPLEPRGATERAHGVQPVAPEPSMNHPIPPVVPQGGRRKVPRIVDLLLEGERPEDFEEFWKLYPRKDSKNDARKAWLQVLDQLPPIEELRDAVLAIEPRISRLHPTTPEWRKFIKYPAAWLRAAGWEDERPEPITAPAERARQCVVCGISPVDPAKCMIEVKGLGDCDACPWRQK